MTQAVIFDLDGTLTDTERVWDEVRHDLAAEDGMEWPESASRAMMGMIIFNVLMEAAALSMMTPMLSSLRMQVLEREERARMFSFTTMLALLVTAPFGAVTGWLSQVNRSLPMLLNVGLALLSVMVCLRLDRELRDKDIL